MRTNAVFAMFAAVCLSVGTGGCVQRTISVRSNPEGALVYLNDQEIGRTPVTRNFTWYGVYDVELRKDGYQSVKTSAPVIAPWWQIVPIDLVSELFPLEDHHELQYTLRPPTEQQEEPNLLIRRGEQLSRELQSSQKPATQPATRPKKRKPAASQPVR